MADEDFEVIIPPNSLKSKVTYTDGGVDLAALEKAEQVVAGLQGNYLTWVQDDLTNLGTAYERTMADVKNRRQHLAEVFRIAHDVKGQGGSFNYQLMTVIANHLCRIIEKMEGEPREDQLAVIKLLIDAMRLVITRRMEGDGGADGMKMVKGLVDVVTKVQGKAPPADDAG